MADSDAQALALLGPLQDGPLAGRELGQLDFFFAKGVGYGVQMGTRPQTMYGLADSPVA